MARDTAGLLSDALALPEDERARLARALIDSLDAGDEEDASAAEIEAAWRAEVEKREREMERDPTLVVPADRVFAEAERRLRELRNTRQPRRRLG